MHKGCIYFTNFEISFTLVISLNNYSNNKNNKVCHKGPEKNYIHFYKINCIGEDSGASNKNSTQTD